MLWRRFQYPGTNGVIVRRVFDDVKKNHIDPMFAEYPQLRDYYHVSDHELILPNGSKVLFMYAETTAEVERKFTGIEFFDIFIDQAEQFSEHELRTIKTRNRWPAARPGQCKTALFFNPGGCGTEFLRRIFWLKQYKTGERANDFQFIQAYGWDNWQWFVGVIGQRQFYALTNEERFELFISQTQYGRELNALPPSLRAGHLLGSFESFAGQYFAGVWDESKCILRAIDCERLIKPWWTRWTSTDWGFAHNATHFWFASGKIKPSEFFEAFGRVIEYPIDVVIIYRELVTSHVEEQDLAQQYVDLTPLEERKLIKAEYLSPEPAVWAKRGSANTIAETFTDVFERNGMVRPSPADNDRVGGWRLMYGAFKQTCSMLSDTPVQNADTRMLLVSAECPEVISGIPLLVRNTKDAGKLEDVFKTDSVADDVADGVRYGLKSELDPRITAPREVRQAEVYNSVEDPTARHLAMMRFNENEKKRGQRRGWR